MLALKFVAHRGYAGVYPENTLPAITAAYNAGAEYIEVDVQLTRDGVPVLFHDRELQRLADVKGCIHEKDLSELQKLSIRDRHQFPDSFESNQITLLTTFVDFLESHEMYAFIELKRVAIEYWGQRKIIDCVVPLFERLKQRVSFISFDRDILKTIMSESDFSTGFVVDNWNEYTKEDLAEFNWLFCDVEGLPQAAINNEVKPKVVLYEVSTIAQAEDLYQKGFCYLETFRIREMREYFNSIEAT